MQINAKITDYGISQFTTLSPLTANQGTPSYRAPEVIRGETYSFQVLHLPDLVIFSQGTVAHYSAKQPYVCMYSRSVSVEPELFTQTQG